MSRAMLAAVGFLIVAGCAGLAEKECRGDWYQTGLRDGRRGDRPDIDAYARQCARYGVQPDAARYLEGWNDGFGRIHMQDKTG